MARPMKCKKVCQMPKCNKFGALDGNVGETIVMSVEEFETIRLIDYQGFTQEQASEKMNIARTTAQAIYDQARKKLAKTLVEGGSLNIEGGSFVLCKGEETECNCGGCEKHQQFALKKMFEGDKK
ncbi:MAG: DUF134 domain-containing protein [Clostridia bacterium]